MNEPEIRIVRGLPEALRADAAILYDEAFGPKFARALPDRDDRLALLAGSFQLPYCFVALSGDQLAGLAGFQSAEGSLTGGMGMRDLVNTLGLLKAARAALILSLFERKAEPGELVMDGIVVAAEMRGRGIGSRLLAAIHDHALAEGFDRIRLDVIDSNPGARRLYERKGFVATRTERFPYLSWLIGFGGSTTMLRHVEPSKPDPSA